MNSLQECSILINNIVQDTVTILRRPDRIQQQLVKESGIEFNIKLTELNAETVKLLNDQSWRNKK